jgi:hypothetical protein
MDSFTSFTTLVTLGDDSSVSELNYSESSYLNNVDSPELWNGLSELDILIDEERVNMTSNPLAWCVIC